MFKEPTMPTQGEKEDQNKGLESKIKEDYRKPEEKVTVEKGTESLKWDQVPNEVKEEIIKIVGNEFTVKFIWTGQVMDEAGVFDKQGSIEIMDKDEKERKFKLEHLRNLDSGEWEWKVVEEQEKKERVKGF